MLRELWNDECGMVLSAEAVLVGTVAVLGATTGLSMVSTAVNEELADVAHAIRSLDQSYEIHGRSSCSGWTAGSRFVQEDVEKSLEDLCAIVEEHEEARVEILETEELKPDA